MKNQSYYRIVTDPDNDFFNHSDYLRVNCAGHSYFNYEIRAKSVRRDYYLIYLCRGSVQIEEPRTDKPLEAGEVIIFEANQPFSYYKPAETDMEYYWVHFSGYGASEVLSQCKIATNHIFSIGNQESVFSAFQQLFDVFLKQDEYFDIQAWSLLLSILIHIGKYVIRPSHPPANYKKIQTSISYIQKHIAFPICVESLAASEHMSVSRYREIFCSVTGLSPQEYIIRLKLNYACEMMRQSDESIQVIGEKAGYDDPQYFSRLFKKYFGLSPKAYRQKYR